MQGPQFQNFPRCAFKEGVLAWALIENWSDGLLPLKITRSKMGCPSKNLPNQPTQFATLEIEINLQPEDRTQKATTPVAFVFAENTGAPHLGEMWVDGRRHAPAHRQRFATPYAGRI
jgi:hypothetical protein